jgi:hypothetical protein
MYEVRLVFMSVHTYRVEADTSEAAEEIAKTLYDAGDNGISTGSEWSKIVDIHTKAIGIPTSDG